MMIYKPTPYTLPLASRPQFRGRFVSYFPGIGEDQKIVGMWDIGWLWLGAMQVVMIVRGGRRVGGFGDERCWYLHTLGSAAREHGATRDTYLFAAECGIWSFDYLNHTDKVAY